MTPTEAQLMWNHRGLVHAVCGQKLAVIFMLNSMPSAGPLIFTLVTRRLQCFWCTLFRLFAFYRSCRFPSNIVSFLLQCYFFLYLGVASIGILVPVFCLKLSRMPVSPWSNQWNHDWSQFPFIVSVSDCKTSVCTLLIVSVTWARCCLFSARPGTGRVQGRRQVHADGGGQQV